MSMINDIGELLQRHFPGIEEYIRRSLDAGFTVEESILIQAIAMTIQDADSKEAEWVRACVIFAFLCGKRSNLQ